MSLNIEDLSRRNTRLSGASVMTAGHIESVGHSSQMQMLGAIVTGTICELPGTEPRSAMKSMARSASMGEACSWRAFQGGNQSLPDRMLALRLNDRGRTSMDEDWKRHFHGEMTHHAA
jgi:hypothetical protein